MAVSRRSILKQTAAATAIAALGGIRCAKGAAEGKAILLVNHAGFLPRNAKYCLAQAEAGTSFEVIDTAGNAAWRGELAKAGADLGDYRVGDFTALHKPGRYRVRIGPHTSHPFDIAEDIHLPTIRNCIEYFARQRCGDSATGYHAPCHLDDGIRADNGQRQDVTGGWHDACDVRKWVNATIYGMIGLSRVLDLTGERIAPRQRFIDELKWGNRYFLAMQAHEGFVMSHCGGDDGNDWTDNQAGTGDDRQIHTEPTDVATQFNFVTVQLTLARLLREADPAYAAQCRAAAERCLSWLLRNRRPGAARTIGAFLIASVAIQRLTDDQDAPATAIEQLQALQVTEGDARGHFRSKLDSQEPMREIMHGNLPLIGLSEALLTWPEDHKAEQWRQCLALHVDHLVGLAARSAFGIIPFGLYTDRTASPRQLGSYAYRYFMKPGRDEDDSDWWVGINAHLASHGVGLALAARALRRPELMHLAQRQLDWILGVNPFDASTITGTGHNQPPLYVPGHLRPATPLLPGGVMNGIGGTAADQPDLKPRSWQTCEYWTPMVAYTMWLMAELQASRP